MICYNARVILRSLAFAVCLLVPTVSLAQPVATPAIATTSDAPVVTGTAAPEPGMKPGVPPAPRAKHPYFFAAYAAVWLGLLAYIAWLGTRIKSLEDKLSTATNRSR